MSHPQHPLHILAPHFEEWTIGSGVSPRITNLNVRSLSIPEEIDELLNRNTKNRWLCWEYGPGWSVTGVNPETGNLVYDGAQFKPDTPVHRHEDGIPKFKKDGSPDYQKYFSASKCETEPLFLDTGESEYWPGIIADITKRLIITEGAKKAGAALTAGEACISIPGVSCGQRKGRLKKNLEKFCQPGRAIVLGFDSDLFHNPNVCRELQKLGSLLKHRGVLVHVLMLPRSTKGIDDFIVAYGHEAFKQLVDQALTFEEWREQYVVNPTKEVKTTYVEAPDAEENYQLKAQAALFSDRSWVSIDGQLYEWVDTHYEVQSEAAIKRRISDWCRVTAVYTSEGWKRSYATATHVDNIYAWVQRAFSIDPATANPPGLNCLNGRLQISWQGCVPSWELKPHDPKIVYTYVGGFEFNPDADREACDRLLSCLNAPQREIFIKTLAASLDLRTIRRLRGRGIRALLCKGDGNNGKDSLREAVALLYGVGVVGTTVSDFHQYDQGRKFTLAKLEHARISWSSENSNISQLDSLQSLKAAITGETLDLELKHANERPFEPCTVFLFNINNVPNLQASLEAIQSRWAVLSFNKTFKVNANPARGEIEADPRFRYDPNFLRMEVVPALLNKMLAALVEVAMKAIDYNSTEQALREIQEETNHLWAFAREIGLGYQPGGRVYIGDLWERLKQWYLDNGTLVIVTDAKGKEKYEWHDQPRRGDKNVKSSNQVFQRFAELFPKIKRERETQDTDRKGQSYLSGLSIGVGTVLPNTSEEKSKTLTDTTSQLLQLLQELPRDQQEIIRQYLNTENKQDFFASPGSLSCHTLDAASPIASPQPPIASLADSPVSQTDITNGVVSIGNARDVVGDQSTKNFSTADHCDFKVGDRVAHVDPKQKSYNWHGQIVEITPPTAKVKWEERKAMRGGDIVSAQLCNLRLI